MNTLAQRLLLGALVLQVVLAALLWWPRDAAKAAEPLFDVADANEYVALRVSDAAGHEVHLARTEDGWVLPEADAYPADAASVDAALARLLTLTTGSPVTETAGSHGRLQVGASDYVRRVELLLADGNSNTVYLGASPTFSDSYVRLQGQDAVYRGRGISAWDWSATAAGWIDTLYVSIPLEAVASLRLVNANDDLLLTRRDDGGWALAGDDGPLDESAVNALVQRAISVRMAAPLGKEPLPSYGLDTPLCKVTIATDDGTVELTVGAPHEDGYVVKASTAEDYVQVADYSVESLIEATAESLRPAAPAAESPAE